ncbi:MAG: VWA domain-containing protein [Acidobacteria bacterium]|nr:VWA domain-containing protein [Acidobacteriaceae bacterium]MBV9608240.1 VWA domain-containing protein [Acidobacteriota bacterium]
MQSYILRAWRSGLAVVLLVLACATFAVPQSASDAQEQAPEVDRSVGTFKVSVDVVNIFFNVKDKHGLLIPNLTKNDFDVLEDGKPQTIKYFAAEANQPLTLGLLIDTSVSQERVLPMEKEVGAAFLNNVLREKDLAFVISFDVNVDLLQDFTNERRDLRAAMDRTKINGGGGGGGLPGMGGGPVPISNPKGTLLYDAVYLASNEKLRNEVGRKAMILLTDGEDQGSQMKIMDAVEAAQKADAMIYVLLIADRGFYGGMYSGDREMRKLCEETGGRVISVGNKYEKLKEAFEQIANELRSQYNIGYTPTNNKKDGTFRKVEIRSKQPNLRIQARKGYYALAKGSTE